MKIAFWRPDVPVGDIASSKLPWRSVRVLSGLGRGSALGIGREPGWFSVGCAGKRYEHGVFPARRIFTWYLSCNLIE